MSSMTANLSAVSTKVKVGTAAAALATSAALTPAIAAQADIAVPAPTAPAMSEIMAAPVLSSLTFAEQGSWIYFGPQKPDGPNKTTFFEFKPLVLVPGFLQPFFGWTKNLNFQACIFGLSISIGPYGTISSSVGRGC